MPSGFPTNGINKGWFKKTRVLKTFNCKNCEKEFFFISKRVFCSNGCMLLWRKNNPSWNKGIKNTWSKGFSKGHSPWDKGLKRPDITGDKHPAWTGGKESWPKCLKCGLIKNKYRNKTGFCHSCYINSWNEGKNHPHWKGGINSVINRRAALAGAIGSHTQGDWEELKKFYNSMCLCCKQQEPFIKLTEDHIVPLSRGGSNDISNIQPLCKSCNSRKHAKTINYRELYVEPRD